MKVNLVINSSTCIKCGKCVELCPSKIITQKSKGEELSLVNMETCIKCGHCVAVCPTNSVEHNSFPAEKVHSFSYENYPTGEQFMLLCKGRRSNRAFSKKQVPKELINQIVEASHRTPTASNSRKISYTVITNPEKIKLIIEFTLDVFDSVRKKLTLPIVKPVVKQFFPDAYRYVPVFERLNDAYKKQGVDLILRNATGVILYHTPTSYRFGTVDSNLAYQNGSLMAECLGVNQFYLGFVCTATNLNKGKLEKLLGIDGTIQAGMAIGMPKYRFPKYVDREEAQVDFME